MTTREWYERISKIRLRDGTPEADIADQLGVSRTFVQRRVWAMRLAGSLGEEFLTPYFADQFTDQDLQVLHKAFHAGTLSEAWAKWKGRGSLAECGLKPRSAKEIREALREATDPKVRATLEWVLGLDNPL